MNNELSIAIEKFRNMLKNGAIHPLDPKFSKLAKLAMFIRYYEK